MTQPRPLLIFSAVLTSAVVITFEYLKTKEDMASKMEERTICEEEISNPIFKNGRYCNPWETWTKPTLFNLMKMVFTTKNETNVPSKQELDITLPIVKPDISQFDLPLHNGVRVMWIGHATVVAQLDGFTVITDPVFSERAGPYLGPKRYRDTPCSVKELPKIDAVLISHNHFDHLDYSSVLALNQRFGKDLMWFVPMGLKSWFRDAGCENVREMTWWDEEAVAESGDMRVVCTPCQHWCRRGIADENKVLWSSWCVLGPKHSFYFAGDTGYCKAFQQIGRKFGPISVAAIPIGAYHPRWFMSPQHVDPSQAVDVHTDLKAKQSVAIHWGTFRMTFEHYLQPQELLKSELEKRQLSPDDFITVHHGAVTTLGAE